MAPYTRADDSPRNPVSATCRDHPELSESLCMEMMMRQLETSGTPQTHRQVLACLAPWMHNLSFAARWEGGRQNTAACHMHQVAHAKDGR